MTEAEWLACDEPVRLLAYLDRPRGDRRLLLLGIACCRSHWESLTSAGSREAVEWAERFADGEAERDEEYSRIEWKSEGVAFGLEASGQSENFDDWSVGDRGRVPRARDVRIDAAYFANSLMTLDTQSPFDASLRRHARLLAAPLVRDIFGNPFRPVAVDPAWLTSTVVALADGIYDERAFDRLPILADALQDAGCDNDAVLNHCRQPGEHVRGCWVVDLML